MVVYLLTFVVVAIALTFVGHNYLRLKSLDEGNEDMVWLSGVIRSGANKFVKREYRIIIPTVLIVAAVYTLFMEYLSGLTCILGVVLSSIACKIGLSGGTYGNVRTTNMAEQTKSLAKTESVALMAGSTSGISVPAFGMLGIGIVIVTAGGIKLEATSHGLINLGHLCNPVTMRLMTYSMGCSIVGMFHRVAGGNFTKAADISADIVGKVLHHLLEDDFRIPNSVADFIGDCVNDILGNISDLLESFVATPVAAITIAVQIVIATGRDYVLLDSMTKYPLLICIFGLVGSMAGVGYVQWKNSHGKDEIDPEAELNKATYIAVGFVVLTSLILARFCFGGVNLPSSFSKGWISVWIASVLGLLTIVIISIITEYFTSPDKKPVKDLVEAAKFGPAFLFTLGDAIASHAAFSSVAAIAISMFITYVFCGSYGIAIGAVSMLSVSGVIVTIDAFGPVADNAGGIAESCQLPPWVRKITDALDAVGNVTAAIGKGLAIAGAAYAVVALIMTYIGSYKLPDLSSSEALARFLTIILIGAIAGGGIIELFISILTKNTIKAAQVMAKAGQEMMDDEVMAGTKRPDYVKLVELQADQSLRYMLMPVVLTMIIPPICGFVFGPEFVLGFLIGAAIMAIPRAVFMAVSGGAWDNAKKRVESGEVEGYTDKDSVEYQTLHDTTVQGDTAGDTRKDVVGVDLDIVIKLMSESSNTLVPAFQSYNLANMVAVQSSQTVMMQLPHVLKIA